VLGVLLAVPCALACAAWVLGEVLRDRWTWEQWMFWVPAWCIALAAIAGGMACARLLRGAPVARRGAWAFAAVGVCLQIRAGSRGDACARHHDPSRADGGDDSGGGT
jgi:hypothetical protein